MTLPVLLLTISQPLYLRTLPLLDASDNCITAPVNIAAYVYITREAARYSTAEKVAASESMTSSQNVLMICRVKAKPKLKNPMTTLIHPQSRN
jgi:hypothetical protein